MNAYREHDSYGDMSCDERERLIRRGRELRSEAIAQGMASLFRFVRKTVSGMARKLRSKAVQKDTSLPGTGRHA